MGKRGFSTQKRKMRRTSKKKRPAGRTPGEEPLLPHPVRVGVRRKKTNGKKGKGEKRDTQHLPGGGKGSGQYPGLRRSLYFPSYKKGEKGTTPCGKARRCQQEEDHAAEPLQHRQRKRSGSKEEGKRKKEKEVSEAVGDAKGEGGKGTNLPGPTSPNVHGKEGYFSQLKEGPQGGEGEVYKGTALAHVAKKGQIKEK